MCTVIDHRWRHSQQRTKTWLLFFTRCDVFCDLLQYTRTEICNLFVLDNKNSNGLLKDFRGMKREKQVCGCYLTWIWRHLCVFFNRSRSTTNENAHWSHVMLSKTSFCMGNFYCAVKEHGNQEMRHTTRVVLLLMSLCNHAQRNIQFLTTQWSHEMAITSQYRFFREIYTLTNFNYFP